MELLGDGLTARHATLDDLDGVLRLIIRVDVDEVGEADMTMDELRTDVTMPQVDLGRDSLVVTTAEGTIVGWLLCTRDGDTTTIVDTYSDPDERAGTNLDAFLLDEGIRRARDARDAAGVAEWTVVAWAVERDARLALLAELGFEPQRHFIRMRRALTDLEPAAPPDGVALRNPSGDDDLRTVHRISETSFADHWGHEPETWDVFHHRKVARDTFDPALWWLAEDAATGRALGSVIGRTERDLGVGWVAMLGVLREERGRGVGGALLRASFRSLADTGLPAAELAVDADSLTGATRLYEREGMHRKFVLTRHGLRLSAEAAK